MKIASDDMPAEKKKAPGIQVPEAFVEHDQGAKPDANTAGDDPRSP
jgi:hypothetical protein